MRTKHLLYTMALASVFAACTQDEFVTEGGSINPLEGRKSLGKITLVEAEGPSTRWTVDNWNTFNPEVGDGFSYLLVDEPRPKLDGQHEYPIDNYELVNHIHTNYVFKFDGKEWGNDANLVEGNYLLIGPDQKVQNRKPVEIKLPAEQNLTLGEDGKVNPLSIIEEFNKSGYPILIGHRFLSEDGDANNVLPTRYNIFAYPEITVKNSERNDELTPVVTKVILKRKKANNPFIINAPLDNVKAARLLTNESFKAAKEGDKNQFVVGEWEAYMNKTLGMGELTKEQAEKGEEENTQAIPATADYTITMLKADTQEELKTFKWNNGLKGFTKDLLAEKPTSTSQYIVINMPGKGVEVPRGTEFTFNAVIPADQYVMANDDTGDLEIFAVLSTGEVYKKIMNSNETVEMYPGKRYPDQDYNGTGTKTTVGEYFTIDVNEGGSDGVSHYEKCDADEIDGLGNVDAVKTTQELIDAILGTSSTQTLNVTVEGDQVVYNKAVNEAVANKKSQIVNILGHIKIEGDDKETLTISDKVSFEDVAINKGTVVFDSKTAELGTVLVSKNATFELKEAKAAGTIYNVGTLKLYSATFKSVENYNNLEVYANLTTKADAINNRYEACEDNSEIISLPINLKPSVAVKAESKTVCGTYAISDELDYPIVVERLNDEVAGALILTGNVKIVKKGGITNNGTINSFGAETLTVARGLDGILVNEKDGVITSKVIIEGASNLLSEIFATADKKVPADYKAAAQATNNGEMLDVQVDGKLIMGEGSYVNGDVTASDETEGEIDNTGKGVFVGNVNDAVTVYAVFNGMDWRTDPARQAEKERINGYQSYNVELIRLTGEVKVGDGDTGFNSVGIYDGDGIALEFAEGSSLSIGAGTLTSNLDITVSNKNIQWNGQSTDRSKFNLTGTKDKGYYIDETTGKVAEGNVWFRRCQVVDELGSDEKEK